MNPSTRLQSSGPSSSPSSASSSHQAHDGRPPWLGETSWPFGLRTIEADGSTISYTDIGTGPTLLLVNVGMWSIIWRDVMIHLRRAFRCVTLDVPGTGLSSRSTSKPTTLLTAADAIDAVVRQLDLAEITLVVHDLGAPATLEAAARWTHRVAALAVVNGFGWRPAGAMFRGMLVTMGNPAMREVDAWTGWLPRASATRFGVARHWDHQTRRTYLRGMRRVQRRSFHRFMAAARRHDYTVVAHTIDQLADRPLLTIFGERNDPLHFEPQWKARFPHATQVTVAKGYHFPMCDDPGFVARTIDEWHTQVVAPRLAH